MNILPVKPVYRFTGQPASWPGKPEPTPVQRDTPIHAWRVSPREAISIQKELAARVRMSDDFGGMKSLRLIAGGDLAFDPETGRGYAAIAVYSFPQLEEIEAVTVAGALEFPYIPGLLSFREAPLLIKAWRNLRHRPDILIHDGQGVAHPRRIGIASHLGVILDVPAIGCAKSRLTGSHAAPGPERGGAALLRDGREVIGKVLRTRENVSPVYVSIGHRVSLSAAARIVLRCCRGYRLPEPTRRAHILAGQAKRKDA